MPAGPGAIGAFAVAGAVALVAYTYLGYPLLLRLLVPIGRGRARSDPPSGGGVAGAGEEGWPDITIAVSLYNEEAQAEGLLESLLALDYPPERRQILIVSDGSTDATNEIVQRYVDRGVEFVALPERAGKTAAENAVSERIRAGIVVNTDASIRILPGALKPLIAAFRDPGVGLASGRDVSVARTDVPANLGESGYVGYEMAVRDLETRLHGIVGASGSYYAIRTDLHRIPVPAHLSRDFAAALKCQEHGYRAVSVPEAASLVPRTTSLRREYGRKVRTITRGMGTLVDRSHLLNPFRHGTFAWMLFSHKVCRWAVPWAGLLGAAGLGLLAIEHAWARLFLVLGGAGLALGAIGWRLGDGRPLPRILQLPAFGLMGNVAAMHALVRTVRGRQDAVWEPTRRERNVAS